MSNDISFNQGTPASRAEPSRVITWQGPATPQDLTPLCQLPTSKMMIPTVSVLGLRVRALAQTYAPNLCAQPSRGSTLHFMHGLVNADFCPQSQRLENVHQ